MQRGMQKAIAPKRGFFRPLPITCSNFSYEGQALCKLTLRRYMQKHALQSLLCSTLGRSLGVWVCIGACTERACNNPGTQGGSAAYRSKKTAAICAKMRRYRNMVLLLIALQAKLLFKKYPRQNTHFHTYYDTCPTCLVLRHCHLCQI